MVTPNTMCLLRQLFTDSRNNFSPEVTICRLFIIAHLCAGKKTDFYLKILLRA